jgi:hypothetical protein
MSIHQNKIEILWVLKCIKKSCCVACVNTSENGNKREKADKSFADVLAWLELSWKTIKQQNIN